MGKDKKKMASNNQALRMLIYHPLISLETVKVPKYFAQTHYFQSKVAIMAHRMKDS